MFLLLEMGEDIEDLLLLVVLVEREELLLVKHVEGFGLEQRKKYLKSVPEALKRS